MPRNTTADTSIIIAPHFVTPILLLLYTLSLYQCGSCVCVCLNQNMSSLQTISVSQLVFDEAYRKAFAYCISKTPFVVRSGSRMAEAARKMRDIFRVALDEVITVNYTEAQLLELCSSGVIEDEAWIKVHCTSSHLTCFVSNIRSNLCLFCVLCVVVWCLLTRY